MSIQKSQYIYINKDAVDVVEFLQEDVLSTENQRRKRHRKLKKALIVGKRYHRTVKVWFRDKSEEIVRTSARIWDISDKHVVMSGNQMIPIQSVVDIDFDVQR